MIAVELTDGSGEVFIGTRDGMAIRFQEAESARWAARATACAASRCATDDVVVGDGSA